MANKNVPGLRFEGFSDAWEQRKFFDNLEKIIDFRGRTPKKLGLDWSEDGYLALSALNVKSGYIDPIADAHYGNQELYDKWMNGRELRKGQVLFTTEAPMGNVAQVPDNRGYILSQRTIAFDVQKEKITDDFLATLLSSPKVFNELSSLSSGGTAKGVSQKSLSQFKVVVPIDLTEQRKIGSFFKTLNGAIALHQRKLEQLKSLKQGYLQQLFSQNDEKVPKVRFANFEGDWEQRMFEDCFNFPVATNSLSRAMLNYDEGEIKSVHYGDVLIKYPSILNIKREEVPYIINGTLDTYHSNLLKNGDLIFADAAEDETVGKAVEVNGITNENLVSGLHTIVARVTEQKAEYFLGYYINSDIYHRQLLRLMQGSKVSAISKGNLQKTNVSFPKDMEEQKKIGIFFKQFDNTIALNQQKVEDLKKLKQGFLKKMFL